MAISTSMCVSCALVEYLGPRSCLAQSLAPRHHRARWLEAGGEGRSARGSPQPEQGVAVKDPDVVQRLRRRPSFGPFDLFLLRQACSLLDVTRAWIFYVAVEPYVRRYWPQSLTSWSRVFEGRMRDPLVGRDILFGATAGVVSMVVAMIGYSGQSWLGSSAELPFRNWDVLIASIRLYEQATICMGLEDNT